MLSGFVSKNQKDWDDYISLLMIAYRSSEHQTTEISPYELVLSRQTTLPVDMAMGFLVQIMNFPLIKQIMLINCLVELTKYMKLLEIE